MVCIQNVEWHRAFAESEFVRIGINLLPVLFHGRKKTIAALFILIGENPNSSRFSLFRNFNLYADDLATSE